MLISLTDYAKSHNVDASRIRHKILDGKLPAQKIGSIWVIDSDTPYIDYRRKENKKEKASE